VRFFNVGEQFSSVVKCMEVLSSKFAEVGSSSVSRSNRKHYGSRQLFNILINLQFLKNNILLRFFSALARLMYGSIVLLLDQFSSWRTYSLSSSNSIRALFFPSWISLVSFFCNCSRSSATSSRSLLFSSWDSL
jgi:hypothetical protein